MVLPLGDPRLRRVCTPVEEPHGREFVSQAELVREALDAFRATHGFGRALAAPQLGIPRRFVAWVLGDRRGLWINPELVARSRRRITLWDDCMCFPDLLVRVSRHASVSLRFQDESGAAQLWENLDAATSELAQHELDHLDGVLAVDRALDREALILRAAYDADPVRYAAQVDYVIGGGEVSLRPVRRGDLPPFFEHQRDVEGRHMAAFTAPDPEDRKAFLAHWKRILADPTVVARTVVADGRVAGHLASFLRDGQPEVTYWLGREHWGKGLATRALARFLHCEQPARPLYARAAKDNAGSLRVLTKCGFQVVGEERGFAAARGREIAELVLVLPASRADQRALCSERT